MDKVDRIVGRCVQQHEEAVMNNILDSQPVRTILVPVMLTPQSCQALPEAIGLAQKYGGKIILFHVVQLNIVGEVCGIPLQKLRESLGKEAEETLKQFSKKFSLSDVPIEILVTAGDPKAMIMKQAANSEADMIVMAKREHRGLLNWFHRNTADFIFKNAPCPVWVVCPQRGDAARSIFIAVTPNYARQNSKYYADLYAAESVL